MIVINQINRRQLTYITCGCFVCMYCSLYRNKNKQYRKLICMYMVFCSVEKMGKLAPSDIVCWFGWWKMLCGDWISDVGYSVSVASMQKAHRELQWSGLFQSRHSTFFLHTVVTLTQWLLPSVMIRNQCAVHSLKKKLALQVC